jgi:REP element-mobilizing transposase RayT
MSAQPPLEFGYYYHIYNRGTNGENIFRESRNYAHFLNLWVQHIEPVAGSYCFCLMRNHFHFLVRIRTEAEQEAYWRNHRASIDLPTRERFELIEPSRAFNNMFIAYAKAFNKAYGRTGALFERPFKRVVVDSEDYFSHLVVYVHRNPQKHGFVHDFRLWPNSSYRIILSQKQTHLLRDDVLTWFGGRTAFEAVHQVDPQEALIASLIWEDWL